MKYTFRKAGLVVLLMPWAPLAKAGPGTETAGYTVGVTIPDNNLNGVADTHSWSSAIQSITSVSVSLEITGGYDGDYYAYLRHGDTGFAVLLNRSGVTSASPYGSFGTGLNVTLSDSAAADIHGASVGGGVQGGTWQPDGRNVSPLTVLDTTSRTALLSVFDGMSASGDWTLFVADVSSVGVGTLTGWGLTVTGVVPEPGASLWLVAAGVLLPGFWRARQA